MCVRPSASRRGCDQTKERSHSLPLTSVWTIPPLKRVNMFHPLQLFNKFQQNIPYHLWKDMVMKKNKNKTSAFIFAGCHYQFQFLKNKPQKQKKQQKNNNPDLPTSPSITSILFRHWLTDKRFIMLSTVMLCLKLCPLCLFFQEGTAGYWSMKGSWWIQNNCCCCHWAGRNEINPNQEMLMKLFHSS